MATLNRQRVRVRGSANFGNFIRMAKITDFRLVVKVISTRPPRASNALEKRITTATLYH